MPRTLTVPIPELADVRALVARVRTLVPRRRRVLPVCAGVRLAPPVRSPARPARSADADLPAPAVPATHGGSPPAPPEMNALLQLLTAPNVGALLPYVAQVESVVATLPGFVTRAKNVIAAEQHKTGLQFAIDVLSPGGLLDGALTAAELKAGIPRTPPAAAGAITNPFATA